MKQTFCKPQIKTIVSFSLALWFSLSAQKAYAQLGDSRGLGFEDDAFSVLIERAKLDDEIRKKKLKRQEELEKYDADLLVDKIERTRRRNVDKDLGEHDDDEMQDKNKIFQSSMRQRDSAPDSKHFLQLKFSEDLNDDDHLITAIREKRHDERLKDSSNPADSVDASDDDMLDSDDKALVKRSDLDDSDHRFDKNRLEWTKLTNPGDVTGDWAPASVDRESNGGFGVEKGNGRPVPYRLNGHLDIQQKLPWNEKD